MATTSTTRGLSPVRPGRICPRPRAPPPGRMPPWPTTRPRGAWSCSGDLARPATSATPGHSTARPYRLSPATSPRPRDGASMAYDPATGTMILFGGEANNVNLSDTWSFNGTTWIRLSLAASLPLPVRLPGLRCDHAGLNPVRGVWRNQRPERHLDVQRHNLDRAFAGDQPPRS